MHKSVKKSMMVIYSILSTFLAYIPMVNAQQYSDIAQTFGEVANILIEILKGLTAFLKPLLPLFSDNPVLGRLVLGILIAIVLYMGVSNVEFIKKQQNSQKFAKAISIIIAIIATIGIPNTVITGIFGSPESNGWQFWLFVIAAIILLLTKGESRMGMAFRGLSFLIIGLGLMGIRNSVSNSNLFYTFVTFAGVFFVLAALYYFLYKVWTGISKDFSGVGEGASNWFGRRRKPKTEKLITPIKGKVIDEAEKEKGNIKTIEKIEMGELNNLEDIIKNLKVLREFISKNGVTEQSYGQIGNLYARLSSELQKHKENFNIIGMGLNKSINLATDQFKAMNLARLYDQLTKQVIPINDPRYQTIKKISANFISKASEINRILTETIRIINGYESNNRKKLSNLITNINKLSKENIVSELDGLIKEYVGEERLISGCLQQLEKLNKLEDEVQAELRAI